MSSALKADREIDSCWPGHTVDTFQYQVRNSIPHEAGTFVVILVDLTCVCLYNYGQLADHRPEIRGVEDRFTRIWRASVRDSGS